MKQTRDLGVGIIFLTAQFDAVSGKWLFKKGGRWYELTTADITDIGKAAQRDTALERVQALCTPYRTLEEALRLAETALGIHSRVDDGVLVLFDVARRVLETRRADEVYVNIWDGPQSGGAVR